MPGSSRARGALQSDQFQAAILSGPLPNLAKVFDAGRGDCSAKCLAPVPQEQPFPKKCNGRN